MKTNSVKRISSLAAMIALFLGSTIMMFPPQAGADGEPAEITRQVWTAAEAEMAREFAAGLPLEDIINRSVTSGKSIHDVIAAAIKVGIGPYLAVYTSIKEGYAALTIVKAALKAGAPFAAVLKASTHAELKKKAVYFGDVVTAAIKGGVDPSQVVHSTIKEGYPAQIVIRTALKAGAPLDAVVKSAFDAGADTKSIFAGAAEAGKSPNAVERALLIARTPVMPADKPSGKTAEQPVFSPSAFSNVALTPRSLEPPPAVFGRGGAVLTRLPSLSTRTSQAFMIGPLKINPFFALSETFSDNVFFTTDNKKRDSITTITPGVRVQLPFQAHSAGLGYYSVITRYNKNEFRFDDTSDHHVNAAVDLVFGDGFGLRLSEKLDRDHEPRSSSASGDIEVFHANATAVSAAYRASELVRMRIDYTMSSLRYPTDHSRDREAGEPSGSVFYRVLPRASLFIEYGRRNIAYVEKTVQLDSTVDTMQAGATWDLSARSKGTIKAGLARKDFTSSTRRDVTVYVWSADVRHEFVRDTTLILTAQRSLNEPNRTGTDHFISTGYYAELTYRLIKDWAAVLRGATVADDYSALKVDRTLRGGGGFTYKANGWLGFAVDYNVHQRNSSVLGKYVEHATGVTADISF